jgi:hypothetical protein
MQCYDIADGAGGSMRVQLGKPPDAKTVEALQELARIVRQSAAKRRVDSVSPEFAAFLQRRRRP